MSTFRSEQLRQPLSLTGSFTGSFTGSLAGTASYADSSSYALTASYANQASSASYVTASAINGTVASASYALTASYAMNGGGGGGVSGGTDGYIPLWSGSNALTSSLLYQSESIVGLGTSTVAKTLEVIGDIVQKQASNTAATSPVDVTNLNSFNGDTIEYGGIDIAGYFPIIASNTSSIAIGGDWTLLYPVPPYTFTTLNIGDNNNTIVVNPSYYTLPVIDNMYYDGGLDQTIFTFSQSLEPIYYTYTTTYTGSLTISGSMIVLGSVTASNSVYLSNLINANGFDAIKLNPSTGLLGVESSLIKSTPAPNNTLYSTFPVSSSGNSGKENIILGKESGGTNGDWNVMIGTNAGRENNNAGVTNFIGYLAGAYSTSSNLNNFIGQSAGHTTNQIQYSNFIGYNAGILSGWLRPGGNYSIHSNFIGSYAGLSSNSPFSNFIGCSAGNHQFSSSYSTFIGFNVGSYNYFSNDYIGLNRNNIIIGTNISLPAGTQDSINIGGILFGTGSYFNTGSGIIDTPPYTGSAGGKIGINVVSPTYNFQVSGTVGFPNLTTTSSISNVVMADGNGQLFITASSVFGTGGTTNNYYNTASYIATGSVTASVFPALSPGNDIFQITSASVTRTSVDNRGIQRWLLNNGITEAGVIAFTTPSSFPGIVFSTSGSTFANALNRFNFANAGTYAYLGFGDSTSRGNFAVFSGSNNTAIGYTGTPTDTGYRLYVSGPGTSGSLNINNVLYVSSSNTIISGSLVMSGSSLTIDIPSKAANYVLKSDANGGATWANPSILAANIIATGSVSASVNIGTSTFSVSSGSKELMRVINDGTTRFSGSISIGDPALNGLGLKITNTYGNSSLAFGNDGTGNLSLTPTNNTITFKGRYKIDSAGSSTSVVTCSILELTSTTAGFLPPRMSGTQAEAINTPLDGLMVYCNNGNGTTITSTGWWGYSGSAWHKFNIT